MPCVNDPWSLFLFVSILNLIAYFSPCITQASLPRRIFLALNFATFCNLLISIHAPINASIGLMLVFVLFGVAFASFSLIGSILLLSSVMIGIGFSVIAMNSFATIWIERSTGVRMSETALEVLVLVSSCLGLMLGFLAHKFKLLDTVLDAGIFSILAFFSIRYFLFLGKQDWPKRTWLDSKVTQRGGPYNLTGIEEKMLSSPFQICCDDVDIECPVWVRSNDMLFLLFMFLSRLTISLATRVASSTDAKSKDAKFKDAAKTERKTGETVPLVRTGR